MLLSCYPYFKLCHHQYLYSIQNRQRYFYTIRHLFTKKSTTLLRLTNRNIFLYILTTHITMLMTIETFLHSFYLFFCCFYSVMLRMQPIARFIWRRRRGFPQNRRFSSWFGHSVACCTVSSHF